MPAASPGLHDAFIKTDHVAGGMVKVAKAGQYDLIGSVAQRVLMLIQRPLMFIKSFDFNTVQNGRSAVVL